MPEWVGVTALTWLESTGVDIIRYAVFAIGIWLVLWVLLRRVMRPRKIRGATPPARQLIVEFLISLRSIAVFSTVGLIMFGLERAGLLPGPAIAAGWGAWWFAASLVLMIVAHDAYFYWTHRLIHDPRLFRRFHRRHHRSNNPSPFTAYSFDLSEAAVNALFVPLWMITIPTAWEVLGLFMLHQIARNTIGHSGYEIMPARRNGRPLIDWITTPTHHDIHHAEAGWNYGLYFTWWDRLMGTEHPDYHARYAAAARQSTPNVGAAVKVAAIVAALGVAACRRVRRRKPPIRWQATGRPPALARSSGLNPVASETRSCVEPSCGFGILPRSSRAASTRPCCLALSCGTGGGGMVRCSILPMETPTKAKSGSTAPSYD